MKFKVLDKDTNETLLITAQKEKALNIKLKYEKVLRRVIVLEINNANFILRKAA